jgi:hypothetical protein
MALAATAVLGACTREGFEGEGTISGKVAHHGDRISEANVFIAFGKKEFPGSLVSDFDASVIADTGGNYVIENLKKGDYYLYAVGYDSTIAQTVRGGIPVTIGKGESLTADIPVTE